jgi:DNA-binding NarL/FixJ family response regulator
MATITRSKSAEAALRRGGRCDAILIQVPAALTERKEAEEPMQRVRDELEGKVERQMLQRNPYGLTFRELTVLHLVSAGMPDKGIGMELGISPLTAQKHMSNILTKMESSCRTEACVRAVREGLLE